MKVVLTRSELAVKYDGGRPPAESEDVDAFKLTAYTVPCGHPDVKMIVYPISFGHAELAHAIAQRLTFNVACLLGYTTFTGKRAPEYLNGCRSQWRVWWEGELGLDYIACINGFAKAKIVHQEDGAGAMRLQLLVKRMRSLPFCETLPEWARDWEDVGDAVIAWDHFLEPSYEEGQDKTVVKRNHHMEIVVSCNRLHGSLPPL